MPAQRSPYPRCRGNTESLTGPATRRNDRRLRPADSLEPGELHADVATPVGSREVSTEPATSPSPILGSRALRRQRSAHFVHAVFHYNRSSNDLQPWFWYGYPSPSCFVHRFLDQLYPAGQSTTPENGLPHPISSSTVTRMTSGDRPACVLR